MRRQLLSLAVLQTRYLLYSIMSSHTFGRRDRRHPPENAHERNDAGYLPLRQVR
jgi:hypothetical protein